MKSVKENGDQVSETGDKKRNNVKYKKKIK